MFWPKKCCIRVAGITLHPIVDNALRLGYAVAPEGLCLYNKIANDTTDSAEERQRDRAPVAIFPWDGRKEIPPRLSIALNSTRVVCIDLKIASGNNEPRGLTLDEDDPVSVVRVQPKFDVGHETQKSIEVDLRVNEVPGHFTRDVVDSISQNSMSSMAALLNSRQNLVGVVVARAKW